MRAKKSLGQHFLSDAGVVERIHSACAGEAEAAGALLEIGPGRGALTDGLVRLGAPFFAVEADWDLAESLTARYPEASVALGDARDLEMNHIARETGLEPWLVVGNLPYNAGTVILRRILGAPRVVVSAVVMLQREVAGKFCAGPGDSGYGALGAWAAAWWEGTPLFQVRPGSFTPVPKVMSTVCRFRRRERFLLPPEDAPPYRRFLAGIFAHPRKTLLSNLLASGEARRRAMARLEEAGIEAGRRPKTVTAEALSLLFRKIREEGRAPRAPGP